jgi:RimJ/RimL family protein N-acetyltransferase
VRITSQRFVLRDFREADRSAFLAFQSDPRLLARYGPEASAPSHADTLFQRFTVWASERPRRKYQLAVFHRKHPRRLIGCCGLRGEEGNDKRAEMGIGLAPECWGRHGYAVEIVDSLLEFGFRNLDLEEVRGITASKNDSVARLARWFGAAQGGSFPSPDTGGLPQAEWRITREGWESRRSLRRRWATAIRVGPR